MSDKGADLNAILKNLQVVVVHHRSEGTLFRTLDSLTLQGIQRKNVLIVDNSEDIEVAERIRTTAVGCGMLVVPNRGYGAAVNRGVEHLANREQLGEFLLVSTHEAQPATGAVAALIEDLLESRDAGVVGPVLLSGRNGRRVWSSGGRLTRFLKLPRHIDHGRDSTQVSEHSSRTVDWLDGAFLLYRSELLLRFPISEVYFLYNEEVDHQCVLRRNGWNTRLVGRARAWQSSNGTPPYWLIRNTRIFQRRNGTPLSRALAPTYVFARAYLGNLRSGEADLGQLHAARKASICEDLDEVFIVNPLGSALCHYVKELESTFARLGINSLSSSVAEPSAGGTGRITWVYAYFRLLLDARRRSAAVGGAPVVSVWPVLGYLDIVLIRVMLGHRGWLVIHDPRPLVPSVGTGTIARWLIKALRGTNIVAHSAAAADHIAADIGHPRVVRVKHPITDNKPRMPRTVNRPKVVRVLGRYKNDRDLTALREVATSMAGGVFEIHGRGWPPVPGWSVRDQFVSEEDLDDLIGTADLVLIPYKRFYQSGIAVRCFENGTAFVGPKHSVLQEMIFPNVALLADDSWPTACRAGLELDPLFLEACRRNYIRHSDAEWEAWHRTALGHTVPRIARREKATPPR